MLIFRGFSAANALEALDKRQGSMVLLRFKNPLLDLAPSTLVA